MENFNMENPILNFDTHQRRSRSRRQTCLSDVASVQLSFSLCTLSTVKTVHLLGSWDNYSGQLPLSHDKASSKFGAWKETYKFQGTNLQAGKRYWCYYINDGYHVSHDPAQASTIEPTTGRALNILDNLTTSKSSKSSYTSLSEHSSPSSRREARTDIPKGRPLSISQIQSPKPVSPHATKDILETGYGAFEAANIAGLTSRFSEITIDDEDDCAQIE